MHVISLVCIAEATPALKTEPICCLRTQEKRRIKLQPHTHPKVSWSACRRRTFLHPDFFKIAKYAKACGFSCGVTTNGTLIDRSISEKIVRSGIDPVTFSLDGLEDAHNRFRNKRGAFQVAVRGIENLQRSASNSVVTQVTSVVHRKNIHQLDALYELVCQLNVASWRVINLEPIGRAPESQELLLNV